MCTRLGVDNAHRQLHGALLDAQLLAEVYIGLTSGQEEIGFSSPAPAAQPVVAHAFQLDASRPRPRVVVAEDERAAHEARLATLRKKAGRAVWDVAFAVEEEALAG